MGKNANKKEAVYDEIVRYMMEKNYPPSIREIGAAVGLQSTSSVYEYIRKLKEEGRIDFEEQQPRTISVKGIRYLDERR